MTLLSIISFLLIVCVNADVDHGLGEQESTADGAVLLEKRPYSNKPSSLMFGVDFANLLFENLRIRGTHLDICGTMMMDFNRVLLRVDYGFLKSYYKPDGDFENSKLGLYGGVSVCYNLIKKNSDHDAFFFGIGHSISDTHITIIKPQIALNVNNGEAMDLYWKVFFGVTKKVFKCISLSSLCGINFGRMQLYKSWIGDFTPCIIAGYGNPSRDVVFFYMLYACFDIPLCDDKRVREEEIGFFKKY